MKDKFDLRNIEGAHLALALARQTGKTNNDVVLEALRKYRPGGPAPVKPEWVAEWRRVLREDRGAGLVTPETPIDAFYDPDTGLPG